MSSTGQIAGGIIGAVAGFFTPIGPLYSAQLALKVGSPIDPTSQGDSENTQPIKARDDQGCSP